MNRLAAAAVSSGLMPGICSGVAGAMELCRLLILILSTVSASAVSIWLPCAGLAAISMLGLAALVSSRLRAGVACL